MSVKALRRIGIGLQSALRHYNWPTCSMMKTAYQTASSNVPSELTVEDLGRLYKVRNEDVEILQLKRFLPVHFRKQVDTLEECVWLCRQPILEISQCLKVVGPEIPSLRIVLWGKWGTGKSTSMYQAIHYAYMQGWVLFVVPNAMAITRHVNEVQMSTYREGRIDSPIHAQNMLENFKKFNAPIWNKLKECGSFKHYKWSKVEETAVGDPITDIVDVGISSPSLASDCVGGLINELKTHCSAGSLRMLVAIEHANSLYGKTMVKHNVGGTYAKSDELTLVVQLRKFFQKDWTNSACVLVADKKEISDVRDHFTVPLNTPLELFLDNIENIEPFIPVETHLYTAAEMDVLYDYYKEQNWIVSKSGRTERAIKQMKFLSAGNPYDFERICAFI